MQKPGLQKYAVLIIPMLFLMYAAPSALDYVFHFPDEKYYTDAVIQPINKLDERGALIDMLPNVIDKSIIVCDRGYESYNTFAHFDNLDMNYIVRIKDVTSNGILSNRKLSSTDEFDKLISVNISNYQKKSYKSLANYRFSPSHSRFEFSTREKPIYPLTFRVVRIELESGKFECIATNLSEDFSPDDIKNLYQIRWGIETSFRQLKYAVGLSNFHAKKNDSIIQEIFARLTLHNFCEFIVQNTLFFKRTTTYVYKINFTRTVQICRKYLRFFNTIIINVEALISKYLSIVRTHRSYTRNLKPRKFTSFLYRVS